METTWAWGQVMLDGRIEQEVTDKNQKVLQTMERGHWKRGPIPTYPGYQQRTQFIQFTKIGTKHQESSFVHGDWTTRQMINAPETGKRMA